MRVEPDSGIWIDGEHVGHLKDSQGNQRILLPAGEHEVTVRQRGYLDYSQKVVVAAGEQKMIRVSVHRLWPAPEARSVPATAEGANLSAASEDQDDEEFQLEDDGGTIFGCQPEIRFS